MDSISFRRLATRIRTSNGLLSLALAAGLCLALPSPSSAQHAGHHGHHGHHGAKKKPVAKKAPAKKRSNVPGASHAGHVGHGASAADTPAVAEFKVAHATMMRGMDVPYTGDPDADFRIQMIPHHAGAIDMARVAMRHASDPWTRQLAEAVIVEQQREIAEMQAWLARRGIAAPQAVPAGHVLTASSYRHLDAEPGTREEARGQSWAPGSGVPARR